jgi:hypothetical protein
MTCPICGNEAKLISGIKSGQYISERCERCYGAHPLNVAPYARKYERDRQREDYRKDIIQRFEGDKVNPEFVDAYPDVAKKQWGDSVLRDPNGDRRKQY